MEFGQRDPAFPLNTCLFLQCLLPGGVTMIVLQRLDMLLKSFDAAKHCLLVKVLLYFEYLLFISCAKSDIIS